MASAKAKIFLGEERGILEKEAAQFFCIFEEDDFKNPYKKAFSHLYRFNEILIEPSSVVSREPESRNYVILLPSMGAINCTIENEEEVTIAAGQAYSFFIPANCTYTISNPFEEGVVGLVEIAFAANTGIELKPYIVTYPISSQPDTLLPFNDTNNFVKARIGLFAGRKEAVYQYQSIHHQLFAFVLQGAFEFEGRLLHAKDALAIWDTPHVELEALSNNAIILLLEFDPNK